mgnify:FL=1
MSFHWEFTIGLREAGGFYRLLALEKWWKGSLGFGLAGALAAWMYLSGTSLPLAARVPIAAGAALAVTALFLAALLLRTDLAVRNHAQPARRERYMQETEISGLGVRVAVGKDRAKCGFQQLERVKETRRAFYLFLAPDQAWILPRAQMDPGQHREVRTLLETVMERRKLSLRKD